MNYNRSGNKPRLSAAEYFRRFESAAITRRRRYNYQPLNNLIGKMIDTTITRNQNRVGAIRPPRAATEGAAPPQTRQLLTDDLIKSPFLMAFSLH